MRSPRWKRRAATSKTRRVTFSVDGPRRSMRPSEAPAIVEPWHVAGEVTAKAAKAFGLAPGIYEAGVERIKALDRAGLTVDDIDLWELNEAFAVQALSCIKEIGVDQNKCNLLGGGVSIGHPIGCTGARITYVASDFREVRVRLPLSWQTRNYVGTIFGGSMYAAVDPVYMLMLIKNLGKEYIVRATMGHIIDLPEKELGIDLEHDFKPKYRIMNAKRPVVKELQALAKTAEQIYLATDPDREGEAIAWHLIEAAKINPDLSQRVVFHEITEPAIAEAFSNPREINMDLVNAQQARRVLDRLVGYNLSPLLWRKVRGRLSAGRVQSVALRLIVERELEAIDGDPAMPDCAIRPRTTSPVPVRHLARRFPQGAGESPAVTEPVRAMSGP